VGKRKVSSSFPFKYWFVAFRGISTTRKVLASLGVAKGTWKLCGPSSPLNIWISESGSSRDIRPVHTLNHKQWAQDENADMLKRTLGLVIFNESTTIIRRVINRWITTLKCKGKPSTSIMMHEERKCRYRMRWTWKEMIGRYVIMQVVKYEGGNDGTTSKLWIRIARQRQKIWWVRNDVEWRCDETTTKWPKRQWEKNGELRWWWKRLTRRCRWFGMWVAD